MNKKMKELLVQIQEKTKAARSFMDNKEKEKAQAELDAIAGLQREYEQEKALLSWKRVMCLTPLLQKSVLIR